MSCSGLNDFYSDARWIICWRVWQWVVDIGHSPDEGTPVGWRSFPKVGSRHHDNSMATFQRRCSKHCQRSGEPADNGKFGRSLLWPYPGQRAQCGLFRRVFFYIFYILHLGCFQFPVFLRHSNIRSTLSFDVFVQCSHLTHTNRHTPPELTMFLITDRKH